MANKCEALTQALFEVLSDHEHNEQLQELFDAVTQFEQSYGPAFRRIPGIGRHMLLAIAEARDVAVEEEEAETRA
jgi:hypothetical protein